jgi:hypothetical protein
MLAGILTVCTSATSTGLVTTQDIRNALGTTSTADDTYISDLIRRASAWAEHYVGYPLTSQIYAETVAAYDGLNLRLSRTPVRSIIRFFDSTDTGTATAYCSTMYRLEKGTGFLNRDMGWSWTGQQNVNLSRYYVAQSEYAPYYIEYQAGFIDPNVSTSTSAGMPYTTQGCSTSTHDALPQDIAQAVIEKVLQLYRNPGGIQSQRIGELSITYASETEDGAAECLLKPWRRWA